MGESKVCPLCSEVVEEPPFPDTYNAEDFSLLVSECQSRKKYPLEEDTGPLDDEGIITWLLQNASTVTHYFWDIPHMVSECRKGDTKQMLAALKDYGLYVKYIDSDDTSYSYNCNKNNAIIKASQFGTPGIISWLVDNGSNVECHDSSYMSCVYLAADNGRLKNIIRLVNCGANIDGYNIQSILELVASKGYLHIVKWMFEQKEEAHKCVTALHRAIEGKHYDIVQWMVDNKVSVAESDHCKNTSVHYAAQVGNIVLIKWLLEKGAVLFVKNTERESLVHMAAHYGHLELLKWLHTRGCNIFERKVYGYTPLHLAASKGHMDCARYLVHNQCEINSKNRQGSTVLHVASQSNNLSLVQFLVQHNADIHALDDMRNSVLQYALSNNDVPGICDEDRKKKALEWEVSNLNILKWLVGIGCNPKISNIYSKTILNKACTSPFSISIAKWLLEIGLNVDDAFVESESWFHICSRDKNWELLHLCLGYISNINSLYEGKTLLHFGVQYLEVVKLLVEHNADVNSVDADKNSPLHCALQRASFDTAHYLIEHGANINIENNIGDTPLFLAAGHTNIDLIVKLLDKGADVNAKNNRSQSPLRNAICYGNINIINLLINAGADINSLDEHNSSIVKAAADCWKWDIVKLLIEKGADLTIGNNSTLLSSAALTEDIALVKWLLEHGATIANDQSILFNCLSIRSDKKMYMIKLFLQHGADINSTNNYGETILYQSINDLAMVNFLLINGANVNKQCTEYKYSVLHSLIPMNYYNNCNDSDIVSMKYRILQKLLHAGANIDLEDKKGNTVLHNAVTNESYVDMAKLLVLRGANINAQNKQGDSVLHLTTCGEIGLFLCEQGAQINCRNISGTSVLHSAIKNVADNNVTHLNIVNLLQARNISLVKTANSDYILSSLAASRYFKYLDFLVKNVKDINEVDHKGLGAVHYAVKYGMLSVFKELITNGVNVLTTMQNGNTVLHLAALKNKPEIVKYIIENVKYDSLFFSNKMCETPLHLAAISNNAKIGELIVKHVDINCKDTSKSQTALHIACTNGNLEFVKVLVANGADIHGKDNDHFTPVQLTTMRCRSKILKYIVNDVNKDILKLKTESQETLLHLAVKFGKYNNVPNKIVKFILEQNVYPIDTLDCKGNSALHYACSTFMVDIVTMLVEHGANINLRNKKSDTPFHFAARTGSIDVINYLLEKGGDPNIKNKRGNTPNHISVAHGKINPSKCLLQRGADIFSRNQKGNCIIQQTAVSGGTHMFDYLLEQFSKTDINVNNHKMQTALSLAIKIKCNKRNIETLIDKQKDINHQDYFGNTVLHDACRYNSTSYVEKIILKGANVNLKNNDGDTPLHIACTYVQDLSVIQLLMAYIDDFACVNKLGWNVLHCAASKNNAEIIQMLFNLKEKYNKTNTGDTILHIACKNKNLIILRWLIQQCSAIINECNNAGESVLLSCLKHAHIDIPVLDLLLEHGADLYSTNNNGDTALHVAASLARLDFVTYFIQQGLDVNVINTSCNTSLHLAALEGYLDIVKILFEADCDVNAVNVERQSALHLAAKQGKTSVVKFLVQDAHCDTQLVDVDAKNAEQLAEQFEQDNVVLWFKNHQGC